MRPHREAEIDNLPEKSTPSLYIVTILLRSLIHIIPIAISECFSVMH
jgi:hypothetical protein